MVLFLANPLLSVILLVAETFRHRRSRKVPDASQSPAMRRFATFLLLEALFTNAFLLTQLRTH